MFYHFNINSDLLFNISDDVSYVIIYNFSYRRKMEF